MRTINIKLHNIKWLAIITGIIIGAWSAFCLIQGHSESFLFLTLAPMVLISLIGKYNSYWPYLIVVTYYLLISILSIYMYSYFLGITRIRIRSIVITMCIVLTIHVALTVLGGMQSTEAVKGIGA